MTNRFSHFTDVQRAYTTVLFCRAIERIHYQAGTYYISEMNEISAMHTAASNVLRDAGVKVPK